MSEEEILIQKIQKQLKQMGVTRLRIILSFVVGLLDR